jgi:hypothetical protein
MELEITKFKMRMKIIQNTDNRKERKGDERETEYEIGKGNR